jgi:hypothetical protein
LFVDHTPQAGKRHIRPESCRAHGNLFFSVARRAGTFYNVSIRQPGSRPEKAIETRTILPGSSAYAS